MAQGCCTSNKEARTDGCSMCNPAKYPPFWVTLWRRFKAHRERPRRREAVMATRAKL